MSIVRAAQVGAYTIVIKFTTHHWEDGGYEKKEYTEV